MVSFESGDIFFEKLSDVRKDPASPAAISLGYGQRSHPQHWLKRIIPVHFLCRVTLAFCTTILLASCAGSQPLTKIGGFTQQDSLRGSIGRGRAGWDVLKYDISVKPDINNKTISGVNEITLYDSGFYYLQIDLQEPMQLDSAFFENKKTAFARSGNVYFLFPRDTSARYKIRPGERKLRLYFSGKPREAKQPPWDGGWIWKQDELGRPFISVACQGLGASVWYPCKDHQSDEPDRGASLTITVSDSLTAVGNGRLSVKKSNGDGTTSWTWTVVNPINSYLIVPYIGKYVHFGEQMEGEKGKLDLDYWVLDYNLDKAKNHFNIVKPMMQCFEKWMGPYPFYKDGYKLVEAPHLGMEHQSAVAYGNKYRNGYMGMDRSGTGWGKNWDFIIVHESGHEWFGNNITAKENADMWIHEAFTTYSETVFVECQYGLQAANDYVIGQRKNIANDRTIIGEYGINKSGSTDMYDKGANLVHTIRQIINDDQNFRNLLRGLNRDFYHQTVTTAQIENYIIKKTGKKLDKVFDQYLRTVKIPVLEYTVSDGQLSYRWTNCVPGFDMPVRLTNGKWIHPTETFKQLKGETSLQVDPNFYITVKKSDG